MLLLYMLWDDWLISMISGSNEQLQQEFEYTILKPDWHSWWSSKMQSGREDTLEEQYAIKNGGARGVMVIVVGNGYGDTRSNPGRDWLHFT